MWDVFGLRGRSFEIEPMVFVFWFALGTLEKWYRGADQILR